MEGETEQQLYERMWRKEWYRKRSPGEQYVNDFLKKCRVRKTETICDVGCGTGRASQAMKELGYDVTGIDLARNALDPGIEIPFYQADITKKPLPTVYDWLFCTDVMEHLPTHQVADALVNLVLSMRKGAYFVIPTFGNDIRTVEVDGDIYSRKEDLHKTVKEQPWWDEQFRCACEPEFSVGIIYEDRRLIVRVDKRESLPPPTVEESTIRQSIRG